MLWTQIGVYAAMVLGLWAMVHLLRLRLHRVYTLFSIFLAVEIAGGIIAALNEALHLSLDYRVVWVAIAAPEWLLTLAVVYSLLGAILERLPGVLSFSRFLLRVSFIAAAAIAIALVSEMPRQGIRPSSLFSKVISLGGEVERVVGVLALLVLLGISLFVLWFPVRMARNLLVFGVGLIIYFFFRTASTLGVVFLSTGAENVLQNATLAILPACYAYWALTINPGGELKEVRIGHSWSSAAQQQTVLRELERMNTALLRSAKN